MIHIGTISDSIIKSHWEYFESTDPYSKLSLLANDVSLDEYIRDYFSSLNDRGKLYSLIVGSTENLMSEIERYQNEVVSHSVLLSNHQRFLLLSKWKDIHYKISQEAKTRTSIETVLEERQKYLDEFICIRDIVSPAIFTNPDVRTTVGIGQLEKIYKKLSGFFDTQLGAYYDKIYSIFNYDTFISNETWNAYKLTDALGITVCPYCNRNYIHTSSTEYGKTRPELDHFFLKSKYPFLSISLYNLIPSCHICNSNLKGTKDFYLVKHLHPYEEDRIRDFCFAVKYHDDTIEELVADISKFDIQLTPLTEDPEILNCIENSKKTFQLNELYNFHKDVAQELLFKSVYYNKTKIEELRTILGEDSEIDDNFLKRVIIGNYADINNLGKRSLAKYSYDIVTKTELKANLNL